MNNTKTKQNPKYKNETYFELNSVEFGNWTMIPNSIFDDKDLSYKAVGIYCQILRYQNSEEHKIYVTSLSSYKKDGRDGIQAGLKELIAKGFLERESNRDEHGKITGVKYIVHATPIKVDPEEKNKKTTKKKTEPAKKSTKKKIEKVEIKEEVKEEVVKDEVVTKEVECESFKFFRENIKQTSLVRYEKNKIKKLIEMSSEEVVIKAMEVSIDHNASNLGYIERLVYDWLSKGLTTSLQIDDMLNQWKTTNIKAKAKKEEKVINLAENKNYKNKNIENNNTLRFNNFDAREYDYSSLERKLLGWDNEE